MKNIDENALKKRIENVLPTLNEYQHRRYLSAEAKSIGCGGISIVSRLSGASRQTLTEGVKELESSVFISSSDRNPPNFPFALLTAFLHAVLSRRVKSTSAPPSKHAVSSPHSVKR
jgi:hypothetical protein